MRKSFPGEMRMTVPASAEYTAAASLAVNGLGMNAGLDLDTLGDLRTVTAECIDCLCHQVRIPGEITLTAAVKDGSFLLCFSASKRGEPGEASPADPVLTRCVLETLMPQVTLQQDEGGIHAISCAMFLGSDSDD